MAAARSPRSTTCSARTSGARTTTASRTRIPGFIDHVVNKKAEIIRVYLPPDANTLLSVADHCLRSRELRQRHRRRQAAGAELPLDGRGDRPLHARRRHLGVGLERRGRRAGRRARRAAATFPTLETLAAAAILREQLPDLKVRVVNVVDLMRLQPESEHPHGLSDAEFDALFTADRPIVFAYHGYPWLIHRLTYRRTNHENLHVRGYKEEGTTTTPFDMVMLNDLDRFHLVDGRDRPRAAARRARPPSCARRWSTSAFECRAWTREHGEDHPDVRGWTWPY